MERKIFVIERSQHIPFTRIWSPLGRVKTELPKGETFQTADNSVSIRASESGKTVTVTYDMREILRGSVLQVMEDGALKKSSYYEEEGRSFRPDQYLDTKVYAFSARKRIRLGKFLIRSERIVPFTLRRVFGR